MKLKIIFKCVGIFIILTLFIGVLSLVEFKVDERKYYREQATHTVANGWSQHQLITGPLFELSFLRRYTEKKFNKELKQYVEVEKEQRWSEFHLLESLNINAVLEMQERYVGIFKIPVYTADISLSGTHEAGDLSPTQRSHLVSAKLLVSVNDMRGLANQPALNWNDKSIKFHPGNQQKLLGDYIQADVPLSLYDQRAQLSLNLTLRGVDEIGFVPTSENLTSTINASWPHPSFTGSYLPSNRAISDAGFKATWGINSFASSIGKTLKTCKNDSQYCPNVLRGNQYGVALGSSVDVYQMTDRALKYGFLFICLTFVIFSLLELQKKHSIHPIQYGFVGAALAVFYLLVISLSEHIRFDAAYLIGSLACSGLISGYLKAVLKNTKLALILGSAFIGLYAMMYAILQSEDYAFLMGTLLIFALLAAIMYATRKLDWQLAAKHSRPQRDAEQDIQVTL